MSRQDQKNDDLLSSWKEISEFLKCDVKTCRRWEQTAGLPVHRISEVSKSRVFAYKEEVEAWVKKRAANGAAERHPAVRKARRRPGLGWGLGLAAAGLVLVFIWAAYPETEIPSTSRRLPDRALRARHPRRQGARALAIRHQARKPRGQCGVPRRLSSQETQPGNPRPHPPPPDHPRPRQRRPARGPFLHPDPG